MQVWIPIIYTRYCRHAWEISLKVDDSCSKSVLPAARTLRRLKKGPGWNGELLPRAGTWTKCRRLLKLKIRLRREEEATDIGTENCQRLLGVPMKLCSHFFKIHVYSSQWLKIHIKSLTFQHFCIFILCTFFVPVCTFLYLCVPFLYLFSTFFLPFCTI